MRNEAKVRFLDYAQELVDDAWLMVKRDGWFTAALGLLAVGLTVAGSLAVLWQ